VSAQNCERNRLRKSIPPRNARWQPAEGSCARDIPLKQEDVSRGASKALPSGRECITRRRCLPRPARPAVPDEQVLTGHSHLCRFGGRSTRTCAAVAKRHKHWRRQFPSSSAENRACALWSASAPSSSRWSAAPRRSTMFVDTGYLVALIETRGVARKNSCATDCSQFLKTCLEQYGLPRTSHGRPIRCRAGGRPQRAQARCRDGHDGMRWLDP
jgi:hypothetical protein